VLQDPTHRRALALPAVLVFGGFSVIPLLSPYAVGNLGLREYELAYIYFFGGLATAFTSRFIGKLADRHGKREVFTWVASLSIVPFVAATNLPAVPIWQLVCVTTLFFILVSGRFVPAMALVNSGAKPGMRGSLISFSQALQHLSSGLAALCAGSIVGYTASGAITRYWVVGLIAVATTLISIRIARRIVAVS
jgi:predicted MFS family arabinose efflux permease